HPEYVVAPALAAASVRAPSRRNDGAAEQDALAGSPLDRRLSFSSCLVGRSNQLAYSAARRVTETTSGPLPAFSPLYIYAAVGLGKTHLLQAIAHAATVQGRRAIYLPAEKFMYG